MGPLNRVLNRLVGYRSTRTFAKHTRGKVALLHNSGFFSNCSTLLMSVAQAEIHPVHIDVASSFTHFAEPGSSFDWNRYFLPPPGTIRGRPTRWPRSRVAKRLPHHSTYKLLDFSTITDITENYSNSAPLFRIAQKKSVCLIFPCRLIKSWSSACEEPRKGPRSASHQLMLMSAEQRKSWKTMKT